MVLGIYECDGVYHGGLLESWHDWYVETFSPECEEIFSWDFTTRGKTYNDRKEFVRNFAIDWSNIRFQVEEEWSMFELMLIQGEFERLGKQYGLLREFHMTCIC